MDRGAKQQRPRMDDQQGTAVQTHPEEVLNAED